jgi:hypothetical protein
MFNYLTRRDETCEIYVDALISLYANFSASHLQGSWITSTRIMFNYLTERVEASEIYLDRQNEFHWKKFVNKN